MFAVQAVLEGWSCQSWGVLWRCWPIAVRLCPALLRRGWETRSGQESVLSLPIFPLASPSFEDAKWPFSLLVSLVLRKSSQRARSGRQPSPSLEHLPKPAGGCWRPWTCLGGHVGHGWGPRSSEFGTGQGRQESRQRGCFPNSVLPLSTGGQQLSW